MAHIKQSKNVWKAQVERAGVRTAGTFRTKEEAETWASNEEAAIMDAANRKREIDALLVSKAYASLLTRLPPRVIDAAMAIPYTHKEIVTDAVPKGLMSGVYFLVLKGQVVYVGQSKNVFHRLARHIRDGREFDSFNVLPCPPERLDAVEGLYIDAFMPGMNNSFGRPRRGIPAVAEEVDEGSLTPS